MPASRRETRLVETYARTLLEAAKAEGRVFSDGHVLDALAQASPEVLAVVAAMIEHDQLDALPKVASMYRSLAEGDDDVVGVKVTTAVPLDDELRASITEQYEQDLGCKVFLIEHVDPSIIGGVVVEARGQRRDVSVRTRLRAAREALSAPLTHHGGETDHV